MVLTILCYIYSSYLDVFLRADGVSQYFDVVKWTCI